MPVTVPWLVIVTVGVPDRVTVLVTLVVVKTSLQDASKYPPVGITKVTCPVSDPTAAVAAIPVGEAVNDPLLGMFTEAEIAPHVAVG